MNSSGSELGGVENPCECGDEISGSTKRRKCLDKMETLLCGVRLHYEHIFSKLINILV